MRRLVTAAVTGTVLVAATPASAATTIGPGVGSASANVFGCNSGQPCVIASQAHPSIAVAAPISGVVVRWRVRIGSNPGTVQVRVLHREGAAAPRVSGSSSVATTAGSEVVERTARLRIMAGDVLGFEGFNGSTNFYFDHDTVGTMFRSFSGSYPDGSTVQGLPASNANLKFDATIEPDGDGDGWGDDTQDHCPTDASTHDTCPLPVQQTTPPPSDPGPSGTAVDTTAPTLANVVVARGRLLYTLSEAATVRTTLERSVKGRRAGKRCVKPTRSNRGARPCKRWVGARTSDAPGGAGAQSTSLSTQLLAAGAYRVAITARDSAGNVAKKTVTFRRRR